MSVKLAVFGRDVSGSLSPRLHHAAAKALGHAVEYQAISASTEMGFIDALQAFRRGGARGANVTMPYKPHAYRAATTHTRVAEAIGVANTLSFLDGQTVEAHNTDGPALVELLRPWVEARQTVQVLGAGGVARASAWALRELGADLTICARRPDAAQTLATDFGAKASGLVPRPGAGIVVSTLPAEETLGARAANEWIDAKASPLVMDLAYRADGPTPLVRIAEQHGLKAVDGLPLLVEQAALAYARWLEVEVPPVRAAMYAAVQRSPTQVRALMHASPS